MEKQKPKLMWFLKPSILFYFEPHTLNGALNTVDAPKIHWLMDNCCAYRILMQAPSQYLLMETNNKTLLIPTTPPGPQSYS